MNRFRAWGLSAAVAVGVAPAALAADPPARRGEPTTLFDKMFGASKPKAGPAAGTSLRPPTVTAPLPPEVVANALRAEQDAWERRMAVCLKLRQVAADANDESLMRQVDELERQAAAIYNSRVTALGVPKVKPAAPRPAAETATASAAGDLDVKAAADRLTAPATPTSAVRTAAARTAPPADDTVREVQP